LGSKRTSVQMKVLLGLCHWAWLGGIKYQRLVKSGYGFVLQK
jgi:hypothetical protein